MSKAKKVLDTLNFYPTMSNRAVANHVGCHHSYVALLRRRMAHVPPCPEEPEAPVGPELVQSIMDKAMGIQVGGDHYKDMIIQPMAYILANNIPFAEGSVIQYVSRWRKKGGVQDLHKAVHLLTMLIAHEEGAQVKTR